MNILETINELGKKAKDASIKIRVLQKEKKESNVDLIFSTLHFLN